MLFRSVEIDGYGNEVHKVKGGLMNKKSMSAMNPSFSYMSISNNNTQREMQGSKNNYYSDQYPPTPPQQLHKPSLNSLVLSNPREVRDSYRNPLSNPSTGGGPSPSDLKYDPNNHSVSYEPYKMSYMTSTSTKNDNSTESQGRSSYSSSGASNSNLTHDAVNSDYGNTTSKDTKNQHSVTFDIPSSKRDPPEYKSVRTYKPSGIYNADMFSQLKNKLK